MPTILAFDTATEHLSAALLRAGTVVDEMLDNEPNRHTEKLIAMIDALLRKAGIGLADVDAIAFGAGPGAFTGLRVACGVAQGLGWAAEKPLLPASNLEATARHAARMGFVGRLLAAHDARMHECYTAVFEIEGAGEAACEDEASCRIRELLAPELVKPAMLEAAARDYQVTGAAGSGLAAYADAIRLPEGVAVLPAFETTAADIARVGLALWQQGKTTRPEDAAPLYVRNRVALTIEQRRAGEKL